MSAVLAPCSYDRSIAAVESIDAIDPAIDHALSAYPPEIAQRAAVPIRLALGDALCWNRDARCRGRLTGDGYPLELAFSTADERQLRFTAEFRPGGSGLDGASVEPNSRLSDARELLDAMGGSSGACDVWAAFADMQRGAPLVFGAWIGGRVDREATAFKVYVEVPDGTRMPTICPAGPVLPDRIGVPRMVGYTPSTGALESYFRIPSLEPEHLVGVLAPAGMVARARPLIEFIEHAYGYRVRGRLPGPSVGVSYVSHPHFHRVTLHFYARSIWGSDARVRQGFARLGGECEWDAETYLKVTGPVAARESWKTFHGLLGFTLDESLERIALTVGLRPVAA